MIDALASLFGAIVRLIYNLVGENYGLSIIIFAVLTKVVLFPLNLKQAKTMENMKKISPKEQEIRKKYKGNNEKIGLELQKLYSENKINPMAGCLPALIQIPIVLAMFYIVKQPLTYIKQVPQEQIVEYVQEIVGEDKKVKKAQIRNYEIEIADKKEIIDMNFFGINFGDIPANSVNKKIEKENRPSYLTLVVPALSLVFSFIQSKITMKKNNLTEEQIEQQKTMNLMLPFLSAYISYIMPLALGIYWLIGNVCSLISQLLIDSIVKEKKIMLNGGSEK